CRLGRCSEEQNQGRQGLLQGLLPGRRRTAEEPAEGQGHRRQRLEDGTRHRRPDRTRPASAAVQGRTDPRRQPQGPWGRRPSDGEERRRLRSEERVHVLAGPVMRGPFASGRTPAQRVADRALVTRTLVIVACVVVWDLVVRTGLVDPLFLAPPWKVVLAVGDL